MNQALALKKLVDQGDSGVEEAMKYFEGYYEDDKEKRASLGLPGKNLFGLCQLNAVRHSKYKLTDCPHDDDENRRLWLAESSVDKEGIAGRPIFTLQVSSVEQAMKLARFGGLYSFFAPPLFLYSQPAAVISAKPGSDISINLENSGGMAYQTPPNVTSIRIARPYARPAPVEEFNIHRLKRPVYGAMSVISVDYGYDKKKRNFE